MASTPVMERTQLRTRPRGLVWRKRRTARPERARVIERARVRTTEPVTVRRRVARRSGLRTQRAPRPSVAAALRATLVKRREEQARNHRPAPARFWGLLALIVSLNLIGLVMVLSSSSVQALHTQGYAFVYFNRQVMWSAVGLVALVITLRIDYHWWRKLVPALLVITSVLLIAVLMPGIGVRVNGSRSWLGVGPMRFEVSELAKLALLLFSAEVLARRADRMDDLRNTLRPVMIVLVIMCGLVMLESDLGVTIVMASVALAVLFIAGTPLTPLAGVTGTLGLVGFYSALSKSYRRARLFAFLHPSADPQNKGYQTMQALISLASGRFTGEGMGASKAKWGYLPEAHTDFIFAIIGEELGFLGCLMIVALFVAFAVLGMRVALRAPDRFGMLVAGGATAWILVQAFVNIGAVVGILPITGLTLPFVSFGGSSLLITMVATGILLSVARLSR